jgi:hypothetical protein
MSTVAPLNGNWVNVGGLAARRFQCGYCGARVASERGFSFQDATGRGSMWAVVFICPLCSRPSYFEGQFQQPGVSFGNPVEHLPPEVEAIYNEARNCTSANAHTAAVLAARKLLMHIAVDQGAKPGQSFVDYVDYLAASGFVPPHGKGWVDHIRKKGNEATHEIVLMNRADAEDLLTFAEMLLKFIYEFPRRVPPVAPATPANP